MALIEFEEYRQKLHDLKPAIEDLGQAYDLEHAAEEVEELENRASEPGFWDDMEKSQKILQRTKALKDKIERLSQAVQPAGRSADPVRSRH